MMGETGHGDPLVVPAYAVGKLQRRVSGAEQVHRLGHGPYPFVEDLLHVVVHIGERHGSVGTFLELPCDDVEVGLFLPVVRIIVREAVVLNQVDEHGRHAACGNVVVGVVVEGESVQKSVLGLLLKVCPSNIIDAEVDAVALCEVLRLDGGEHRIGPAQGAVALVFDWCDGQHQVAVKHAGGGQRLLSEPIALP